MLHSHVRCQHQLLSTTLVQDKCSYRIMLPQSRCQSTTLHQCNKPKNNSRIRQQVFEKGWIIWILMPSQQFNTPYLNNSKVKTLLHMEASMLSWSITKSFNTNRSSKPRAVREARNRPILTTWSRNSWKNVLHHSLLVIIRSNKCQIEHWLPIRLLVQVHKHWLVLDHPLWLTTLQLHSRLLS